MTQPTFPYLSNSPYGRGRWCMTAAELIERVFPGKNYGTKVPPEESATASIDGVFVTYLTREEAYNIAGRRSNTPMRAWAQCPGCGRMVTASRINQHARVHLREG